MRSEGIGSNMNKHNVLVTGIGGNVGQGILRNIRQFDPNIRIIGTNVLPVSAGNHLCDGVYAVPYSYEENYIKTVADICKRESINLIIPSTDYETLYLSEAASMLPALATSVMETNKIFVDKWLTFQHFSKHRLSFAESSLPSLYQPGTWKEIILKPRKGRGSRGLHINPASVAEFDDSEYMVQKLFKGKEITTAFYVTKKEKLHGFINFERTLESGTTNTCIVASQYNKKLHELIQKIISCNKIRGACNVQSIVTESGDIIPFEINGRISGTNSIRSQLGFKDVQYTLQEYLLNEEPEPIIIQQGGAVRIWMDVIYPGINDFSEIKNQSTKHHLF